MITINLDERLDLSTLFGNKYVYILIYEHQLCLSFLFVFK